MNVQAEVLQGSILGPLFLLIYINDLLGNLTSNPKLFADDTSLCSIVTDPDTAAYQTNTDFHNINRWACQWKIGFNLDPSKQTQEVIFNRKTKVNSHP